MNNIEILEDLTKHIRFNEPLHYGIGLYIQAMENLIKENKELKDKNKKQSVIIIEYQDLLEKSVPKSKLKEKIEEYNIPIFDVLDKLPIMPRTIERGCGAKDGIIYVLQELLEEGE